MPVNTSGPLKLLLAIAGLVAVCMGAFVFMGWPTKTPNVEYGITYSRPYAEELGLNSDDTLATALDTVGIRRFRLSAYWALLEPTKDQWDFSWLDKQISEIGKRNGHVVLAVGEKLPRWPECWEPDWWKQLSRDQQRVETQRYIETVMTRYRDNPTIVAWQIENEPHFSYGNCPAPDYLFIQQETAFARGLDGTRPIYTTDSGELSLWVTLGVFVDKLGISVYRVVRTPWLGTYNFHYWFLPPYSYERKAELLKFFGIKGIYVSEFQMEPWSNQALETTPINDQLSSMDVGQMQSNFWYAERMGISQIDFWGFEWWVWMSKHGHPEFLQAATDFWKSHQ